MITLSGARQSLVAVPQRYPRASFGFSVSWPPVLGVVCLGAAIGMHLRQPSGDSHFELGLLTIGGALLAEAKRSYYRVKNERIKRRIILKDPLNLC